MKKVLKTALCLALALVLAAGIITAPLIKRGYDMYKQATDTVSVSRKVEEICSRQSYTPFEDISPQFTRRLIESEDRRFYYHPGVDPIALVRSAVANAVRGHYVQGGSTITQQLAKNMYFSFEKKMERKIAELFVAFQLEKQCTKEQILAMYCSVVYFGQNCYGIKQAARYYYNTTPRQLTREQSAALVDALKAPSVYNPSVAKEN